MIYNFKFQPQAEALYDALADDAYYIVMQDSVRGPAEQRRAAMLRYYDYSMQEADSYGLLHLPEDSTVGASIWSTPLAPPLSDRRNAEKESFLDRCMGSASLAAYRQITVSMAAMSRPSVPPESWYLSILGIAPAYQGRGLGAELVRPVLQQADRVGRPVFLETFSPRNITFYERLGFTVRAAVDEPVTASRYWVMVRDPS